MTKRSILRNVLMISATWISMTATAAVPPKVDLHKTALFPEGERLVYTRLVEAYHRNQIQEVIKQRQILERNYPRSVHLDNAYYLNGMAELQNNRFGEAIKTFDVVKNRYVKSNKRPGAMFAIGATYQKLNLPAQAHRIFQKIMTEYPGSPEAQRAWMQLRVEKEMAVQPALKR